MERALTAEKITWHAAMPIARRDDGAILTDYAVECASPEAAVECARQLADLPQYVGAVAYTRTGIPALGWYEPAEILRRFGGIDRSISGRTWRTYPRGV